MYVGHKKNFGQPKTKTHKRVFDHMHLKQVHFFNQKNSRPDISSHYKTQDEILDSFGILFDQFQ